MGCRNCGEAEHKNHHEGCLCEVLRFIKRIQDIGSKEECVECKNDCFMAPLGSNHHGSSPKHANTRVLMLLTEDGTPLKAMFKPASHLSQGKTNCLSVFFRVKNVSKECCATLQVLEPRDAANHPVDLFDQNGKLNFDLLCKVENFAATDSCITVDLKCFCGIQCVKDVHINLCR